MKHGWSLETRHWQAFADLCASVVSSTWQQTKLDGVYRDRVPLSPGVYAICSGPPVPDLPTGLYNVLYVGKATALRQRFLNHCQHPAPELARAKVAFGPMLDYWYLTASREMVLILESRLIDCVGPAANLRRGISAVIGPPEPA